mgnify:FL=1
MNTPTAGIAVAGTLAAALALAGTASASTTDAGSAADVIEALQQQGYSVQLNGTADVPLTECRATGVHGVPDAAPNGLPTLRFTTVYVDISCPPDN